MDEMNLDDDITIPSSMMYGALYMATGSVAASFVISINSQQTMNGMVTYFRDWGALGFGGAALLFSLFALPRALSKLETQHRTKRLVLIGIICLISAYRVLYGLGSFT